MRAVIIDDEKKIRDTTRALVMAFAPQIALVGEGDSVAAAVAVISATKPDLVFLDVEMADGTGFDVLQRVSDHSFAVIFITAHDHFALRAFRFSAVDYLLKPVDPDELVKAIEKVGQMRHVDDRRIPHLLDQAKKSGTPSKIMLSDAQTVHLVAIADILRCQSENNYTRFFMVDGQQILVSRTLKEYEDLLVPAGFFRVHQSHLINLAQFARMDKREGGIIYLKDGSEVPVAVRRREDLMEILKKLS